MHRNGIYYSPRNFTKSGRSSIPSLRLQNSLISRPTLDGTIREREEDSDPMISPLRLRLFLGENPHLSVDRSKSQTARM